MVNNLVSLTESLVKSLVADPDMITVKEFPSEDENMIIIEVLAPEKYLGAIIGKAGRTANAIRTIVQAASYLNEQKKVKINIDSF